MNTHISKKSIRIIGCFLVVLGIILKILIEKLLVPDGSLDAGTVYNAVLFCRVVLALMGILFVVKPPKINKEIINSLIATSIGCLFALIVLEVFLRIVNPFGFRVKGDKIILPANMEYKISGTKIDKLDENIVHKKNSLGFRGEEPPEDFDEYLTMVVVGASTAECFYLSDNKTWSHVLGEKLKTKLDNFWINNAGLDGHSTFGHIILMEDYLVKLKPKIVLFYTGMLDIAKTQSSVLDTQQTRKSLISYSEVLSTVYNIIKYFEAKKRELLHRQIDLESLPLIDIAEEDIELALKRQENEFIEGYVSRLKKLIKLCKENNIEPIFVTHPSLFGDAVDDVTGVDLGRIKLGEENGGLKWKILTFYNETTKAISREEGVFVVDLANKLPKSSRFYYDEYHYTNEGAAKIGEILFEELYQYLKTKYK